MTQIVEWLFNVDTNPFFNLFYQGVYNATSVFNSHLEDEPQTYFFACVLYIAFIVFCVWLSVKLISWLAHLLGIGGK